MADERDATSDCVISRNSNLETEAVQSTSAQSVSASALLEKSAYKQYFTFKKQNGSNFSASCQLCPKSHRELNASVKSLSNLRTHLKRKHPFALPEVETRAAEKRKAQDTNDSHPAVLEKKKMKQVTLADTQPSRICAALSQEQLDELIINFVVEDLQSLQVVEQPAFRALVGGMAQNRTLMTTKTLTKRICSQFYDMKTRLTNELSKVEHVCTTADLWSSRHRAFLGVTVHWIESQSLARMSAALACRRIKGNHSFDVLAAALEDVHTQYGIRDKVTLTVTDNGFNFVKAFRMFGLKAFDNGDNSDDDNDGDDDGNDISFVEVEPVLENAAESVKQYILPYHQRCAAHTMNLVAMEDAKKAEHDALYRDTSGSALTKCKALWRKVSKSVLAADGVHDLIGIHLIVPNHTHWNSHLDAVRSLVDVCMAKSETTLNEACRKLNVQEFRPQDITFLAEYVKVMQPVALALDVLQSESKSYIGILLPTIVALRKKLMAVQGGLKIAGPLVRALLTGIECRFGSYFNRDDLVLAAVTIPQFRLRWVENNERDRLRLLLQRHLQEQTAAGLVLSPRRDKSSQRSPKDEFFEFDSDSDQDDVRSATAELDMYISEQSNELTCLSKFQLVKTLFLKYNTALPSSARVERLFSLGSQVVLPRRNRLSDEHFEMLLLLRANNHLK